MIIYVNAKWKDTNEDFEATCYIGDSPPSNIDDDMIFYYFGERKEIVGDHGDFIVTDYDTE